MYVVFSVSIVTPGAVAARVWEVCVFRMFRHADVVCLCLVCIMWQFSMLHSRMQEATIWKRHTPEPVS